MVENKMISKQFNNIRLSINKKNKISIVNCYLKWEDHAREKSYLEKMHNEIIKMPVEKTWESLHKFGYLGYLREEVYDGRSVLMYLKPDCQRLLELQYKERNLSIIKKLDYHGNDSSNNKRKKKKTITQE
jgi:hypothetical protein